MKIIYRLSPEGAGYKKNKPYYVNNTKCLHNFVRIFGKKDLLVLFDENYYNNNLVLFDEDYDNKDPAIFKSMAEFDSLITMCNINQIAYNIIDTGSSAKSFNEALTIALTYEDDEIVYFVENDYIHKAGSKQILTNIFESNICENLFASLYQHPDKFLHSSLGGNPFTNPDNSYSTIIHSGKDGYWNVVDSTTMTFATKVKTLKLSEPIMRECTTGNNPSSVKMFWKLNAIGCRLVTPLDSYATHGETAWLAKFTDWDFIINHNYDRN